MRCNVFSVFFFEFFSARDATNCATIFLSAVLGCLIAFLIIFKIFLLTTFCNSLETLRADSVAFRAVFCIQRPFIWLKKSFPGNIVLGL